MPTWTLASETVSKPVSELVLGTSLPAAQENMNILQRRLLFPRLRAHPLLLGVKGRICPRMESKGYCANRMKDGEIIWVILDKEDMK